MNERIRELAEQATTYIEPTSNSGEGWVFNKEKFAEMIVRECVHCVLNGRFDEEKFNADDLFDQGHNKALNDTAEGIKQHFGVIE